MSITVDLLEIGNNIDVTLDGFKDGRVTGTEVADYLNSATVTCTLKTLTNDLHGPVAMSYLAGTKGKYRGSIPASATADLIEGQTYYIEVDAAEGEVTGKWRERSKAIYKQT